MNEEFENTKGEWYAHDEWQFADREAAYKFFYLAGAAAMCEKMRGDTCLMAECMFNGSGKMIVAGIADVIRKIEE